MKLSSLKLTVFTLFACASLSVSGQTAQKKMDDAMQKMLDDGWTSGSEYDTKIMQGDTWTEYRTCYNGNEYAIIAFPAEDGVYNLDVQFYDPSGNLIASESKSDPIGRVDNAVPVEGEYKMKVTNKSSNNSSRAYAVKVVAYYRGASSGTSTSTSTSSGSGGGLPATGNSYGSSEITRIQDGMTAINFDSGDEFTTKMAQGDNWYKYRTCYTGNYYVVYAVASDANIKDLSLSVYDDQGNLITQETKSESIAMVQFDPSATGEYKIQVQNTKSNNRNTPTEVTIMVFYGSQSDIGTSSSTTGGRRGTGNTATYGQSAVDQITSQMTADGYSEGSTYDFTSRESDVWFQYRECYENNEYVIYAIPMDDGIKNLNLQVIDGKKTLANERDNDPIARVELTFDETKDYKIEVTNDKSKDSKTNYQVKTIVFYK